eukprot:m.65937 g.65937  ORF g.65937 m.65937 type:complete len:3201 (+) comp9792_c0_seq1:92-9694(+)
MAHDWPRAARPKHPPGLDPPRSLSPFEESLEGLDTFDFGINFGHTGMLEQFNLQTTGGFPNGGFSTSAVAPQPTPMAGYGGTQMADTTPGSLEWLGQAMEESSPMLVDPGAASPNSVSSTLSSNDEGSPMAGNDNAYYTMGSAVPTALDTPFPRSALLFDEETQRALDLLPSVDPTLTAALSPPAVAPSHPHTASSIGAAAAVLPAAVNPHSGQGSPISDLGSTSESEEERPGKRKRKNPRGTRVRTVVSFDARPAHDVVVGKGLLDKSLLRRLYLVLGLCPDDAIKRALAAHIAQLSRDEFVAFTAYLLSKGGAVASFSVPTVGGRVITAPSITDLNKISVFTRSHKGQKKATSLRDKLQAKTEFHDVHPDGSVTPVFTEHPVFEGCIKPELMHFLNEFTIEEHYVAQPRLVEAFKAFFVRDLYVQICHDRGIVPGEHDAVAHHMGSAGMEIEGQPSASEHPAVEATAEVAAAPPPHEAMVVPYFISVPCRNHLPNVFKSTHHDYLAHTNGPSLLGAFLPAWTREETAGPDGIPRPRFVAQLFKARFVVDDSEEGSGCEVCPTGPDLAQSADPLGPGHLVIVVEEHPPMDNPLIQQEAVEIDPPPDDAQSHGHSGAASEHISPSPQRSQSQNKGGSAAWAGARGGHRRPASPSTASTTSTQPCDTDSVVSDAHSDYSGGMVEVADPRSERGTAGVARRPFLGHGYPCAPPTNPPAAMQRQASLQQREAQFDDGPTLPAIGVQHSQGDEGFVGVDSIAFARNTREYVPLADEITTQGRVFNGLDEQHGCGMDDHGTQPQEQPQFGTGPSATAQSFYDNTDPPLANLQDMDMECGGGGTGCGDNFTAQSFYDIDSNADTLGGHQCDIGDDAMQQAANPVGDAQVQSGHLRPSAELGVTPDAATPEAETTFAPDGNTRAAGVDDLTAQSFYDSGGVADQRADRGLLQQAAGSFDVHDGGMSFLQQSDIASENGRLHDCTGDSATDERCVGLIDDPEQCVDDRPWQPTQHRGGGSRRGQRVGTHGQQGQRLEQPQNLAVLMAVCLAQPSNENGTNRSAGGESDACVDGGEDKLRRAKASSLRAQSVDTNRDNPQLQSTTQRELASTFEGHQGAGTWQLPPPGQCVGGDFNSVTRDTAMAIDQCTGGHSCAAQPSMADCESSGVPRLRSGDQVAAAAVTDSFGAVIPSGCEDALDFPGCGHSPSTQPFPSGAQATHEVPLQEQRTEYAAMDTGETVVWTEGTNCDCDQLTAQRVPQPPQVFQRPLPTDLTFVSSERTNCDCDQPAMQRFRQSQQHCEQPWQDIDPDDIQDARHDAMPLCQPQYQEHRSDADNPADNPGGTCLDKQSPRPPRSQNPPSRFVQGINSEVSSRSCDVQSCQRRVQDNPTLQSQSDDYSWPDSTVTGHLWHQRGSSPTVPIQGATGAAVSEMFVTGDPTLVRARQVAESQGFSTTACDDPQDSGVGVVKDESQFQTQSQTRTLSKQQETPGLLRDQWSLQQRDPDPGQFDQDHASQSRCVTSDIATGADGLCQRDRMSQSTTVDTGQGFRASRQSEVTASGQSEAKFSHEEQSRTMSLQDRIGADGDNHCQIDGESISTTFDTGQGFVVYRSCQETVFNGASMSIQDHASSPRCVTSGIASGADDLCQPERASQSTAFDPGQGLAVSRQFKANALNEEQPPTASLHFDSRDDHHRCDTEPSQDHCVTQPVGLSQQWNSDYQGDRQCNQRVSDVERSKKGSRDAAVAFDQHRLGSQANFVGIQRNAFRPVAKSAPDEVCHQPNFSAPSAPHTLQPHDVNFFSDEVGDQRRQDEFESQQLAFGAPRNDDNHTAGHTSQRDAMAVPQVPPDESVDVDQGCHRSHVQQKSPFVQSAVANQRNANLLRQSCVDQSTPLSRSAFATQPSHTATGFRSNTQPVPEFGHRQPEVISSQNIHAFQGVARASALEDGAPAASRLDPSQCGRASARLQLRPGRTDGPLCSQSDQAGQGQGCVPRLGSGDCVAAFGELGAVRHTDPRTSGTLSDNGNVDARKGQCSRAQQWQPAAAGADEHDQGWVPTYQKDVDPTLAPTRSCARGSASVDTEVCDVGMSFQEGDQPGLNALPQELLGARQLSHHLGSISKEGGPLSQIQTGQAELLAPRGLNEGCRVHKDQPFSAGSAQTVQRVPQPAAGAAGVPKQATNDLAGCQLLVRHASLVPGFIDDVVPVHRTVDATQIDDEEDEGHLPRVQVYLDAARPDATQNNTGAEASASDISPHAVDSLTRNYMILCADDRGGIDTVKLDREFERSQHISAMGRPCRVLQRSLTQNEQLSSGDGRRALPSAIAMTKYSRSVQLCQHAGSVLQEDLLQQLNTAGGSARFNDLQQLLSGLPSGSARHQADSTLRLLGQDVMMQGQLANHPQSTARSAQWIVSATGDYQPRSLECTVGLPVRMTTTGGPTQHTAACLLLQSTENALVRRSAPNIDQNNQGCNESGGPLSRFTPRACADVAEMPEHGLVAPKHQQAVRPREMITITADLLQTVARGNSTIDVVKWAEEVSSLSTGDDRTLRCRVEETAIAEVIPFKGPSIPSLNRGRFTVLKLSGTRGSTDPRVGRFDGHHCVAIAQTGFDGSLVDAVVLFSVDGILAGEGHVLGEGSVLAAAFLQIPLTIPRKMALLCSVGVMPTADTSTPHLHLQWAAGVKLGMAYLDARHLEFKEARLVGHPLRSCLSDLQVVTNRLSQVCDGTLSLTASVQRGLDDTATLLLQGGLSETARPSVSFSERLCLSAPDASGHRGLQASATAPVAGAARPLDGSWTVAVDQNKVKVNFRQASSFELCVDRLRGIDAIAQPLKMLRSCLDGFGLDEDTCLTATVAVRDLTSSVNLMEYASQSRRALEVSADNVSAQGPLQMAGDLHLCGRVGITLQNRVAADGVHLEAPSVSLESDVFCNVLQVQTLEASTHAGCRAGDGPSRDACGRDGVSVASGFDQQDCSIDVVNRGRICARHVIGSRLSNHGHITAGENGGFLDVDVGHLHNAARGVVGSWQGGASGDSLGVPHSDASDSARRRREAKASCDAISDVDSDGTSVVGAPYCSRQVNVCAERLENDGLIQAAERVQITVDFTHGDVAQGDNVVSADATDGGLSGWSLRDAQVAISQDCAGARLVRNSTENSVPRAAEVSSVRLSEMLKSESECPAALHPTLRNALLRAGSLAAPRVEFCCKSPATSSLRMQ